MLAATAYISELLLALLLTLLIYLLQIDLSGFSQWVANNFPIIIPAYGICIAFYITFLVHLLNESDTKFIRFLSDNKSEKRYRQAVLYTIALTMFGMILVCVFSTAFSNNIAHYIILFMSILNITQLINFFTLLNGYVDLKRLYQSKKYD